ncbi:MAG: GTP pyrophosphokinase [Planctomycetota bacterium]|jgi:ppGpp synthetase/RelA/SpoT-type nucleotidyltranferase
MDLRSVREEFEARRSRFERLKEKALYVLDKERKRQKIKVHILYGRIKEIDSFVDKIRRKGIKKPFAQIHDIVALRIVCLFRSDVQRVGNVVRTAFRVIDEEDKTEHDDPRIFEYGGFHFIAKLKEEDLSPEDSELGRITFEIQVRTIGQDAWAAVSHHLDYKKERGIPDALRQDFNALSGLFHVADSQFELVRREVNIGDGMGEF